MFQIVAATKNMHKVEEFKNMLKDMDVEIICASDIDDFPDIVEDGTTFEENAAKKAIESSIFAGMPSFADDSGLVVEALDGAPGVMSARYAGENANDNDRVAKLLEELDNTDNRSAKFVCVIAIANDGELIGSFRGEVKGRIVTAARGSNGFGYDPVFVPNGHDKTFAELGSDVKDKISHRAKALEEAVEFIEDELATMQDFDLV